MSPIIHEVSKEILDFRIQLRNRDDHCDQLASESANSVGFLKQTSIRLPVSRSCLSQAVDQTNVFIFAHRKMLGQMRGKLPIKRQPPGQESRQEEILSPFVSETIQLTDGRGTIRGMVS